MKLLSLGAAALSMLCLVVAQDGTGSIPTTTTASSYSCDPTTCKLPTCLCASQSPPNGLAAKDVPQFVTITFDDSVQPSLLATANQLLDVKNPNGCGAKGSWYVSMEYTDFSLVQQWYANGNEVADHTFSHVGSPSSQEIAAAKAMLHEYAGIPQGKIKGFRAPFLNYTAGTLSEISQQGFQYDSSATAVVDDCYWPYTLDNGMANDCWTGICDGAVKLPGIWEIPMYAVNDNASVPQLMDNYLAGSVSDVTEWSNTNFDRHYNGNRQPFGIYVHPTHLTNYPGLPDPSSLRQGVISFIQSLAGKPDVWFVSNDQLLQWMQNPVPASELANQSYMKCELPNTGKEICNGLEKIAISDVGLVSSSLLNTCNFNVASWGTCFNCPSVAPTLATPLPPLSVQSTDPSYRHPVPDNCDSIWWDPVAGQCLCTTASCAYKDVSVTVNTTTAGTTNSSKTATSSGAAQSAATTHENAGAVLLPTLSIGAALMAGAAAVLM
ncbi:hypothetical protein J3Q64DRAFT_1705650 [Phycomyces blakesleeanus]|uniref:NodB homology domain-containing protein n=2 Tax=Phycomyces blakesleeanus TaxID=4837 RepID=A0A167PHY3_PHYB8|nr:hypothetical protein PHYBLDRAFT_185690 [Phycomyces blakesleeanus NRRL 1555(-)]OAD77957.1 hypothetical protein PHYBLDRAFT_185690 [Phycomyces blakesleeanus NRRL 1555(-)]|eukprot:XP_018295997.1 hypothetical protein PHYBLDRAFT_185690 [Phycomyces blakesleeanus NRRL 1555(-)]